MTCEIKDGVRYRMPVVFGPSASPRQHPEGRMWTLEETGRMRGDWVTVRYRTHREKIERLLPPGFSLRGDPIVSVSSAWFRDLFWLAGRSYGILQVEFPVTYRGKTETIDGNFCPVLWEGEPDAIITGREELGFPKMFASFTDLDLDEDSGSAAIAASWFGHTFFEAEYSELREVPDPDNVMPGSGGYPSLYYKYMPRTAQFGKGGADVSYVTTTAQPAHAQSKAEPIPMGGAEFRKWVGRGRISWKPTTFQQIPLGFHVINALADLDILEVLDTEYVKFSGPGMIVSGDATMRAVEPV